MKSKLDFIDNYKNILPSIELASRIRRITETVEFPFIDTQIYRNIINNPAFMELAATASKMQSIITCIDSFYIRFNPAEPDEVQDFSRHKIFHGQALNYDNEINSLKLILYLDELFYMMSSLKTLKIA